MWSLLVGKFQKGACRYLLHRYLGQYLLEKVTVDQLTVDLYNGTGSVTDVSLDCDALNGLAEQHNLPIEFVEGSLDEITFAIPWSTIMQDSCEIQIKGLRITIQPKNRVTHNGASSMIDSMFTSMASSMQLAEECLKISEDIEDDQQDLSNQQEMSGLEHCAKTIDAVLSRVKISFQDTIIRLERCQRGSDVGVALEFHINLWEYSDDSSSDNIRQDENSQIFESAFSHKKITLEGLTCHSEIFSSKQHFTHVDSPLFTSTTNKKSSTHDDKDGDNSGDNSSEGDDNDEEEEEENAQPERPIKTVQVGKFSGVHEIKLQVKTDESMTGPQVSVDCSFGSLIALLSPLQAHILYDLINEIVDPSENLSERAFNRRSCSEKPMDSYDFKRVEKELQEKAKPENIGLTGLSQQQGWSSACYGGDESDDEFQPLKGRSNNNMYNSQTSNFMNASVVSNSSLNSSMMHQSMSDSLNISAYKSAYNYSSSHQATSSSGSGSEKTKFSISFASVSLLLLHEDILSLSSTDAVFPETLLQMQNVSRQFFQTLYYFGAGVKGEKDIAEVREKMNGACELSHHRLIAAPLKIKGMVKSSTGPSTSLETSGTLAIGYFELIESLKDKGVVPSTSTPNPQCIEVLTFPRNFDHGSMQALKMEFKTESRKGRISSSAGGKSKTSLKFTLNECRAELDVSVVDRINSLINSPLHYYMEPKDLRNPIYRAANPPTKSQSIMRINVKCPNFSLNFRFPIPDLRPLDDNNRIPHWIRNVHNDSIVIQMKEVDFSTALASSYDVLEFDTKCHEAKLFYKTTPADVPTLFATALADDPEVDGMSMRSQGLDWPRLLVWISPKVTAAMVEAAESEDNEQFDTMNFMSMPKKKPSPFSSKRIVHETSSNSPDDDEQTQGNESVIPGDRNEMGEFIEETNKSVVYRIDLNFRFVEVSLPSKHFFEEIYNRVGNDLLLWEPSCIKPSVGGGGEKSSAFRSHAQAAFSMCKSALRFDPDSDEEGDMTAFYSPASGSSTLKNNNPDGTATSSPTSKHLQTGQSEVTLCLSIGKGIGSFFTPLQDASGNTIPGQKGQMSLKVQQGNLFFVSGYKGNPNQGFLCIITQKAELHHADFIRTGDPSPRLSSPELVKTIYPSEEGMLPTSPSTDTSSSSDMLSVAIKIDRDPLKNLKIFKVATGIRDGTLDHRLYLPNRNWFSQLTDFFDVTDMPVIGYIPSVVLTELHLHLWNCAVDYRPLHIPLRSVLTMETFSISSNIAAATSTSVLRFMAEDATFFISSKPNPTSLRDDYVSVMDMDYFELSLRICSNRASPAPRIDLSAASNALHIRTCSDSFKSLLELLTYYANDGDLFDPNQRDSDSLSGGGGSGGVVGQGGGTFPESSSLTEPALITTEELSELGGERKLSTSHLEHVHDLVAEAMLESEFGGMRMRGEDNNKKGSFPKRNQDATSSSEMMMKMPPPMKPQPMYDLHFTPDFGDDLFECKKEPTNFFPYDNNDDDNSCTSTPLPLHFNSNLNANMPIMETSGGPIDIQGSDEDEEEFCILENDPGVGIIRKNGEPEARVLTDEPIRLIENYFSPPVGKMDALKAPKHYPSPVAKYSLKEMTIVWHLYGGDDFGLTPSRKSSGKSDERGSSETVYSDSWKEQQNAQMFYNESSEVDIAVDALNPGVVFSKTKAFESAWEAYESPKNPRKHLPDGCISWRQQGGKGRRHDTLVELHLNKIKLVHEIYPDSTEQASRQVILINSVEILDKLRSSQFNKLMYLYTTPNRPKQTHANMITIKAAHIRPDPQLSIEECCLKISILPVRLNIDQDALLFLYQYFSDLSVRNDSEDEDSISGRFTNPPSHTPSVESLPVMTVNVGEGGDSAFGAVNMQQDGFDDTSSNLLLFNEDPFGMDDAASTCSKDPSIDSAKSSTPVYFRQVIFAPEVPIRLDYRGKRVDMTHGPLAGLLMGLAQLNCSEIRLKQIYHRHGILGFDRLIAFLINEWAVDIKKNQLPSLLGGVGPIHSFVQLFQGMRDLFWLPIEQYQKDGRIAKGLQRGVNAFSVNTAMAALELTNKLIQTIQGAAEFTYDMVSPGPSVQQKRRQTSSKRRKRYTQPGDIREGMTNAYNVVREGLGDTAHTIVRVASKEHEQKGISGAVGGVLRQIPPTVVRPIILVAEATSNVLDGFRSQLEPEFKKENEEKWKET